jgi:hypothetical protein
VDTKDIYRVKAEERAAHRHMTTEYRREGRPMVREVLREMEMPAALAILGRHYADNPSRNDAVARGGLATMVAYATEQDDKYGSILDTPCAALIHSFLGRPKGNVDRLVPAAQRGIALGRWANNGEKVYEVSPALTDRLRATEVRGVHGGLVTMPFDAFSVRLDPAKFAFEEIIISREKPPTERARQHLTETLSTATPSMELIAKQNGAWDALDATTRVFQFTMSSHGLGAFCLCYVPFYEDRDLTETLAAVRERYGDDPDAVQVITFAMNLVLYLSWPDTGDVPEERVNAEWAAQKRKVAQLNGYKKERAKERLKALDADRRLYIGAKVPFMSGGPEAHGTGDKLLVRTLVSGHWKQQPCGPKHSERKLIRIEPYWKGPIDGALSNPVRRVS